jgi:flagellar assembly protein FliH
MSWWSEPAPRTTARLLPAGSVNGEARPARLLVDARRHRRGRAAEAGERRPDPLELLAAELERVRREALLEGERRAEERLRAELDDERARRCHELERAATALREAADEVLEARLAACRVVEDEVARLAFELASVIVGRELELAQAPGLDALRRALRLVPDEDRLVVRLHPDDLQAARQAAEQAVAGERVSGSLELVADPDVERGGCVVEAGPCRIDAQVGPAIERVRKVLRGGSAPSRASTRPGQRRRSGAVTGEVAEPEESR